jgi:hypothetical protein
MDSNRRSAAKRGGRASRPLEKQEMSVFFMRDLQRIRRKDVMDGPGKSIDNGLFGFD